MNKLDLLSKVTRLYIDKGNDNFIVCSLNLKGGTVGIELNEAKGWLIGDSLCYIHLQPITVRAIIIAINECAVAAIDKTVKFSQYSPESSTEFTSEKVYNGAITIERKDTVVNMIIEDAEDNEYVFNIKPTPYTEMEVKNTSIHRIYAKAYADTLSDIVALIPEALYRLPGSRNV